MLQLRSSKRLYFRIAFTNYWNLFSKLEWKIEIAFITLQKTPIETNPMIKLEVTEGGSI